MYVCMYVCLNVNIYIFYMYCMYVCLNVKIYIVCMYICDMYHIRDPLRGEDISTHDRGRVRWV